MLSVKKAVFSYTKKTIIHHVSFDVQVGCNAAIIGESGCGKSTLLQLIYGLYDLDEGHIFWNDVEVFGPKFNLIPGVDSMKYLAQDFDLMPFITVAENVGKYLSNLYPEKKKNRVLELLELVEMTEFASVKAKYLSGGQMQRVAIARVLALEPELLLLDEPFSHIDNFRKNSLRRKLFAYLKEKKITCIVATHDSTDVLSFADEVVVLKEGAIIEKGTPKYIFEHPKNKYVASLFGDVNELEMEGKMHLVYPHQLKVVEKSNLKVIVVHSYFRGNHYLIESNYNKQTLFFESEVDIPKSSEVYLKKIDSQN
jgi:ABC-type sulfate/molybdate transport systems ATPase subunit